MVPLYNYVVVIAKYMYYIEANHCSCYSEASSLLTFHKDQRHAHRALNRFVTCIQKTIRAY